MLSGLYSMVGCVTELWSATSCWVVTNVMPLLFFFLDSLLVVSCSFARLVLGTGKGNRETRREDGRIKKSWRRSGEEKEAGAGELSLREDRSAIQKLRVFHRSFLFIQPSFLRALAQTD